MKLLKGQSVFISHRLHIIIITQLILHSRLVKASRLFPFQGGDEDGQLCQHPRPAKAAGAMGGMGRKRRAAESSIQSHQPFIRLSATRQSRREGNLGNLSKRPSMRFQRLGERHRI